MADKSTRVEDILHKKEQQPPQQPQSPMGAMGQAPPIPMNTSENGVHPSARFGQMPGGQGPGGQGQGPTLPPGMTQVGPGPMVSGPSQGMSSPPKPVSGGKEFFGLKETDYKSTVVVFALILLLSSNVFVELLANYLPAVMQDGKTTLIGSLILALIGSVVYIAIKCMSCLAV
jgi:hypothetical protein